MCMRAILHTRFYFGRNNDLENRCLIGSTLPWYIIHLVGPWRGKDILLLIVEEINKDLIILIEHETRNRWTI